MARIRKRVKPFEWSPLSKNQYIAFTWYLDDRYKDMDGILMHGARRAGKSISARAFIEWAFTYHEGQDFIMAGKTVQSFRRNIYWHLRSTLQADGYIVSDIKNDEGYFEVINKRGVSNYFYVFGGKDKSSAGIVQGSTVAGIFLDEMALMPEEFVNMCMSSCSIENSKYWFTTNPDAPEHYVKVEYIDKAQEKNLLVLHFTMDDNKSLSDKVKERYARQFTGVFYDRYIKGLWVRAEGIIYTLFANNKMGYRTKLTKQQIKEQLAHIIVGVDFGGTKSGHSFVATGYTKKFDRVIPLKARRILKKLNPIQLENAFITFVQEVYKDYGRPLEIRYDNAEPTLAEGLKMAARDSNVPMTLKGAKKTSIIGRIELEIKMFAVGYIEFTDECEDLELALSNAVWNPKKDMERLDDGTLDIDTLDAFEYSFEPLMKDIIRYIGVTYGH